MSSVFDPTAINEGWFDPDVRPESAFDKDLTVATSTGLTVTVTTPCSVTFSAPTNVLQEVATVATPATVTLSAPAVAAINPVTAPASVSFSAPTAGLTHTAVGYCSATFSAGSNTLIEVLTAVPCTVNFDASPSAALSPVGNGSVSFDGLASIAESVIAVASATFDAPTSRLTETVTLFSPGTVLFEVLAEVAGLPIQVVAVPATSHYSVLASLGEVLTVETPCTVDLSATPNAAFEATTCGAVVFEGSGETGTGYTVEPLTVTFDSPTALLSQAVTGVATATFSVGTPQVTWDTGLFTGFIELRTIDSATVEIKSLQGDSISAKNVEGATVKSLTICNGWVIASNIESAKVEAKVKV